MQRSTWLAAMLLMTAAFMIFSLRQQPATLLPGPEIMLQQARDQAEKAGRDKKELSRVIKLYDQVAKSYRKTEYAAQARLEAGELREEKLGDQHGALKAYRDLVRDFPPDTSKASAEAKLRLAHLGRVVDKRNSRSPLYKIMDFFVALTGRKPAYSYCLALIFITAIIKVLITPLTHAQFRNMREMQRVAPLVKQLQEKYKGDQKEMGQRLMALYKEQGINPISGCLPMLAQFPVLILLYQMVRLYEIQFTKGYFLWIGSELAARYPSFMGRNLAEPDIPLLVLYVISMFISQKLTVVDPTQAEQQKIMMYAMPLMFAVLLRSLPSGFIFYWLIFNAMSTVQQYFVLKGPPARPGAAQPAVVGGGAAAPPTAPPRRPSPATRRAKRRKKRFDAFTPPIPAWIPCGGG